MRAFFLFFLPLILFATKLEDISVYDRDTRVDILLSFDKAYELAPLQSIEDEKIVFSFEELDAKPYNKELESKLVKDINIISLDGTTKLIIQNKKKLDIKAAKDENKLTLRIRLLDPALISPVFPVLAKENTDLKAKNTNYDYTNYILVLLGLFSLVVLLWVLKYYFRSKMIDANFCINFQRPLDRQNKFMIIEYEDQIYTMIIGSSNLLLEVQNKNYTKARKSEDITVYADYKPENRKRKEDFFNYFEENKENIQKMLDEKGL